MKILTTLFILLFAAGSALAEDAASEKPLRQFDVEIIIFEDARARYLMSENWALNLQPDELAVTETEKNKVPVYPVGLSSKNINADRFQIIKTGILSTQYRRINISSEYNVLFHGAWRQVGLDRNNAFEININELENAHTSRSENTVTGTFKLVLSRFLHMHSQLEYHREVMLRAEPEMTGSVTDLTRSAVSHLTLSERQRTALVSDATSHDVFQQLNTFPINSQRRMRSSVLHYIDHPLVGMLIQINRTETSN